MIWDAVRYGFSPVYWMTIEGIPVVWTEKATGKSLPTGFTTESAVLSIDKSGPLGIEQIDRLSGNPSTPPFAFRLLDSAVTRDWIRKPSATTTLTAAATATAASLSVVSSTGFSTECFVGMERMTLSGTTPTTLNLSARGVNGWAYAHPVGTGSQLVTDRPRLWKGRQVRLYAAPMDASGYVPGATLASDSIEIWRGRLSTPAVRSQDGFDFEAEALERILDGELPSVVSGKVVKLGGYFPCKLASTVKFTIDIRDASNIALAQYAFTLKPFNGTAYTQNQLIPGATMRKLVSDAFASAITVLGAGADIKGLSFLSSGNNVYYAQVALGTFATATYVKVDATITTNGTPQTFTAVGNKLTAAYNVINMTSWTFRDSPWAAGDPTYSVSESVICIKLDDTKAASIPAAGDVYIGTAEIAYGFTNSSFLDGLAVLYMQYPIPWTDYPKIEKSNAIIKNIVTGGYFQQIMSVLQSSGTAGLRGTYDDQPRGAGYALDSSMINTQSFYVGEMNGSSATITEDGANFWDIFSGLFGLYRRAFVQKYSSAAGRVQLTLVSTAAPFAPDGITITDSELLAHAGDPITAVRRFEAPNSITLTMQNGDQNNDYVCIFNDVPNIEAQGMRSADLKVPTTDREQLQSDATYIVASSFAYDQSAQAAAILVPPWIRADVGDTVTLSNLTHPSLYTWTTSPGQVGYDGLGRIIGRTLDLSNLKVKLVVLFDGGTTARGICPSAEVSAFTGIATNVTSMTVPIDYYAHFAATRTATGGNYYVQHYRPGQVETTTQYHLVTAEAVVGGACVLTIGSHVGGHTVTTGSSRLTLPTRTGGRVVAFQQYFAHVDDGSNWA